MPVVAQMMVVAHQRRVVRREHPVPPERLFQVGYLAPSGGNRASLGNATTVPLHQQSAQPCGDRANLTARFHRNTGWVDEQSSHSRIGKQTPHFNKRHRTNPIDVGDALLLQQRLVVDGDQDVGSAARLRRSSVSFQGRATHLDKRVGRHLTGTAALSVRGIGRIRRPEGVEGLNSNPGIDTRQLGGQVPHPVFVGGGGGMAPTTPIRLIDLRATRIQPDQLPAQPTPERHGIVARGILNSLRLNSLQVCISHQRTATDAQFLQKIGDHPSLANPELAGVPCTIELCERAAPLPISCRAPSVPGRDAKLVGEEVFHGASGSPRRGIRRLAIGLSCAHRTIGSSCRQCTNNPCLERADSPTEAFEVAQRCFGVAIAEHVRADLPQSANIGICAIEQHAELSRAIVAPWFPQ